MRNIFCALVISCAAFGQPIVYPLPAKDAVEIQKAIPYQSGLMMDLYRPAHNSSALPVIVFMNTNGGSQREAAQYTGWASVAAAEGLAAINLDTSGAAADEDFRGFLKHLNAHASELRVNAHQVVLWACSSHVSKSFAIAEDPRNTAVKAAVIYYGYGAVPQWRIDLPVLYVRAGLDRPQMLQGIDATLTAAIGANAPITLLNYSSGHHGFDGVDDTDASREVIAQTLQFVKRSLDPKYEAGLAFGRAEAEAASAMNRSNYAAAATLYAPLAAARPGNGPLQLSYGEALLASKRYAEALAQFQKARGKAGVGFRDFGLPAAKAAALAGEPEKAIEYLRSIPAQFLPTATLRDPDFQTLHGRAEFEAMLNRR